jgi:hypothetical protein
MAFVSVDSLADDYGYDDVSEFLTNECNDSIVPACCSEGCDVEPDGRCEHGHPSALLAMGVI